MGLSPLLRTLCPLFIMGFVITGCGSHPATAPHASSVHLKAEARTLTLDWAHNRTQSVEFHFDQAMRSALPANKLAPLWQQFTAKTGGFQAIKSIRQTTVKGTPIVVVTVQFAKASEGLEWAFSQSGQVTGLHFVAAQTTAWSPPSYDHPTTYTRTALVLGQKPLSVPAVLDRPKGPGPFPAVVLVPGSGPENLNEQIEGGPEEPLRDIADGLASAGIEVLRYDKPTYSDPSAFANLSRLTPQQSDLVDALAAIHTLSKQPGVAPGIFVLGHSAGGYWTPWLAQHASDVRGLILMAAPSKPLAAYLVPQTKYLDALQGPITPQEKFALARLTRQVQRALSPTLTNTTPAQDLPFGLPAAYWRFSLHYSPLTTAASLSIPMLILQGGSDYQVPSATLTQWQAALPHRTNITFKLFSHLDHVFVAVSGKSTPTDYLQPGHVAPAVVRTVARWIHQQPHMA